MEEQLEHRELLTLKKFIREELGFDSDQYSPQFFLRRIKGRMNSLDIDSFMEYLNYLHHNESERIRLHDTLKIHVTHFFRDSDFWKALQEEVIPELQNKDSIRVWSIGCSSGEEPYSILISFMESMKGFEKRKFRIIATDIDAGVIQQAKQAEYKSEQLTETPSDIIKKYFYEKKGMYCIKDDLKQYILFYKHDALNDKPFRNMDLIICRNTVIYFNRETKEKFYEKLYECIVPGGFFVLGKTEMMHGPARFLLDIYNSKERIYRKKG